MIREQHLHLDGIKMFLWLLKRHGANKEVDSVGCSAIAEYLHQCIWSYVWFCICQVFLKLLIQILILALAMMPGINHTLHLHQLLLKVTCCWYGQKKSICEWKWVLLSFLHLYSLWEYSVSSYRCSTCWWLFFLVSHKKRIKQCMHAFLYL